MTTPIDRQPAAAAADNPEIALLRTELEQERAERQADAAVLSVALKMAVKLLAIVEGHDSFNGESCRRFLERAMARTITANEAENAYLQLQEAVRLAEDREVTAPPTKPA
jgi:hypothetical protein